MGDHIKSLMLGDNVDQEEVRRLRELLVKGVDLRAEWVKMATACFVDIYAALYVPDSEGVATARERALQALRRLEEMEEAESVEERPGHEAISYLWGWFPEGVRSPRKEDQGHPETPRLAVRVAEILRGLANELERPKQKGPRPREKGDGDDRD